MINGVPAAAATGRVAMFSLLPLPDTDTERFPGPASPFSVKFPLPHAIFFSPLPCFPAQAPVRALKPSSSSLASLPLSSMIGSGCGQHDENGPSIRKTSPRPPDAKIWAMAMRERSSTTTAAPFALREDVPRRRCNQDRARGMESPRHDRTRLGPRARTSIAADRPEGSSAPTGPMLRPQGTDWHAQQLRPVARTGYTQGPDLSTGEGLNAELAPRDGLKGDLYSGARLVGQATRHTGHFIFAHKFLAQYLLFSYSDEK